MRPAEPEGLPPLVEVQWSAVPQRPAAAGLPEQSPAVEVQGSAVPRRPAAAMPPEQPQAMSLPRRELSVQRRGTPVAEEEPAPVALLARAAPVATVATPGPAGMPEQAGMAERAGMPGRPQK
jgi:hypothetical protein